MAGELGSMTLFAFEGMRRALLLGLLCYRLLALQIRDAFFLFLPAIVLPSHNFLLFKRVILPQIAAPAPLIHSD